MNNNVKLTVPIGKLIVDLGLLIFFGIKQFQFFVIGSIQLRGFFCNDESIAYPYIPAQLVNSNYVYAGETAIVGVVILASEFFHHFRDEHQFSIANLKLSIWVWNIYTGVTAFLFGAACTGMTTLLWKNQVGRLRPHFMDACRPNIDCSDPKNLYVYHINFNCTNLLYNHNQHDLNEMRQSFPCGQLSHSMYCMMYLIIYLENKMTWQGSTFLKHAIQFAAFNSSMYIGFCNVSVYHHYPTDVIAGLILGVLFALFTAHYIGRLQTNTKQIINAEYQEITPSQLHVYGT